MPTKPTTPNAALVALLRPPAGVQSAGRRAFMLLKSLEAVYDVAVGEGGFGARVFEPLWSGPFSDMSDADLEAMLDELAQPDSGPSLGAEHLNAIAVFVGAAYAVRALRADKAGDQIGAWRAVSDAASWVAFLDGRLSAPEAAQRLASRRSWNLKPQQRVRDAVAVALRAFLEAKHKEGAPRPTAADVLRAWQDKKPVGIDAVTATRVLFVNGAGQRADVDAAGLVDRIGRMTCWSR